MNIKNNEGQKASDIAKPESKRLLLSPELSLAAGPIFFNRAPTNRGDNAATENDVDATATPVTNHYSAK
ncbi:hypothetical protein RVIR1_07650 [Candidatus Rickettsiella viridis]|uniref:Uncharacterized protein n=1 Tax=Candidatus Rickettsiella viridis TaxID=676208 RepID=A0A2Z5UUU2_9COXI|nr:hypothetical protein [Candidatus Rickettsiella viridis]BBB15254.1 hypothetical protein RVIR1_07650 [Candidatus Rickettsiella viridis]